MPEGLELVAPTEGAVVGHVAASVGSAYVLGTLAGLSIKGTVIAAWKPSDPATWAVTFRLAAIYLAAAGVAALVLVREAPTARRPRRASGHLRAHLRVALEVPNAKPLLISMRSADAGDDYLICLGEAPRALIVSGDHHLLDLRGEIPVLSPAEFLQPLRTSASE